MSRPSKRLMAIMDPEERAESMKERRAEKKNPSAEAKEYKGKSMKLGYGGRSAKLRDQLSKKGLPKKEIGGIIGKIARSKGAAPGQRNYHGK